MMSHLHWTIRRLAAAMLVAFAASLAGLSPSHAAAAKSSGADLVNGMPCNDLCKSYMAWSNRMAARFSSSGVRAHAALRIAAHAKKPERPAHRSVMAGTHRSGLNSFAQFPQQSSAAGPSAAPRQVEVAPPPEPAGESPDPLFAADGNVAEQRAAAGGAGSEFPETMSIPVADPIAATQQPITSAHIAAGPALRLPISLILALGALLAFGSWGWIRGRTEEPASVIRESRTLWDDALARAHRSGWGSGSPGRLREPNVVTLETAGPAQS